MMDDLFSTIIETIDSRFKLQKLDIPAELAEIRFPLGVLELRCFNWRCPKIRKIYALRMKVKFPYLDILGMSLYPAETTDAPVFTFDLSCTKKKVVTYINPVCMSDSEAYYERYIAPFHPLRRQYCDFPPQKARDWMKQYHTDITVYSMPDTGRLPDIQRCVKDYLGRYLMSLETAEEITDPSYRDEIGRNFEKYRTDLLTKDRSQKMLAKLIGKNRSHRIFHEVLV